MIRLALPILAAVSLLAAAAMPVVAGAALSFPPPSTSGAVLQQRPPVDDSDDTRVGVQLTVAGIAIGVVVVMGSAAYLLRKKLGLVAPPPDQGAAGHQ
jgi:hypothetical protein